MLEFVFRDFQMKNKFKPDHIPFKRKLFMPLQIMEDVLKTWNRVQSTLSSEMENTGFRNFLARMLTSTKK
jgi:hypothetical protein